MTTMSEPPAARLLTDRLQYWARVRPDARCVSFQNQTYTWSQWCDRVHQVAAGLRALGLRRGDRIAFLDQNNLACLEVTLGAAMLGVANVVVNWRLVTDQLGYVLADSAPRVVFVGDRLRQAFEAVREQVPSADRVIVLGGDADEYQAWVAASPADGGPRPDIDPDDTCMVMYSSGTTGHPKGVEITHRNVTVHSDVFGTNMGFGTDAVNVAAMPFFHVGGSNYALAGLHHGAETIVLREADSKLLFDALGCGATHMFLVPAVIQSVLTEGDAAIVAFAKLRTLAYGAAPMPLPLLKSALAAWPDLNFIQVYGMTELAGVTTMLLPGPHRDVVHEERLRSAGRPNRGVEIRIADPVTLEDMSAGQSGEIWFRTAQAMKGYLGKPEATAEVKTQDGWLRTGDIGVVDDGGFVFVVDRVKDMIISGGENIYSPEVESVVAAHPAVAEAAVIGVPDEKWGENVKAVVVLRDGEQVAEADLIAFCRRNLATYKCPKTVDIIDVMPRNPSGKILKRELRKPYWDKADRSI